MKSSLFASIALSLLASCGSDGGGSNGSSSHLSPSIQEQPSEGSYRAVLRPMNNSLSGYLPTGGAQITITGDEVSIKTHMDDAASVTHMQNIHVGSRCPDERDDRNRDGLIDIEESLAVVGSVLVPLDGDLNSALEGEGLFPAGRGFSYSEDASLSKIEADVKARQNQNLNLGGRAVLIHGASEGATLPASAATNNNLSPHASMPIACGIIQRL